MQPKGKVWICSFLPASEGRGIERFAIHLSDSLSQSGWRTEIIDIGSIGRKDDFFSRVRPVAAWRIGRYANRVAGPDDIIVCNNFFSWNARRPKSVVIYHMTEKGRGIATRSKMGRIRNILVRTLNSYFDKKAGVGRRIVTVSEMVRKEVEDLYHLNVDHVVHNAVDLDAFCATGGKRDLRMRLGLPVDKFLVLYVGPPDKKKGLDIILEDVLPSVRDSQHLVLVSDVGVADPSVTVVGRVAFDKIHEYYRACDVLLFPSYYEGWGIAVAEALASGLPAIMPPTGIGYELINDSILSKYVVPNQDPREYVRRLRMLQDSPEEIENLGRASRVFAEKNLDMKSFKEAYTAIIDSVAVD